MQKKCSVVGGAGHRRGTRRTGSIPMSRSGSTKRDRDAATVAPAALGPVIDRALVTFESSDPFSVAQRPGGEAAHARGADEDRRARTLRRASS